MKPLYPFEIVWETWLEIDVYLPKRPVYSRYLFCLNLRYPKLYWADKNFVTDEEQLDDWNCIPF